LPEEQPEELREEQEEELILPSLMKANQSKNEIYTKMCSKATLLADFRRPFFF
jgi:hypothetical protein